MGWLECDNIEPTPMNGQWMGSYAGSSSGMIVVNVDQRQQNYEGVAYLLENDKTIPGSAVFFRTSNKDQKFQLRTDLILAIDPTTGFTEPWEKVKQHFGNNVTLSQHADITGAWDKNSLTLSWVTERGVQGSCVLPRSKADQPSELVAVDRDWSAFRQYVSDLKGCRYLFRGQNKPWRLRTSFHRAGRADLSRFLVDDLLVLHKHLSARTRHVFNLTIPDENGAFLNLIQHHGYPSPLLDWTYSPYVAAFFAYRGISNEKAESANPDDKVRIHVFDQARWRADWAQILMLVFPGPHVSIGEFIAMENERMIPQQAASLVTNIDDIETYIRSKESVDKNYLWAIDLPVIDRRQVVRDLSYMGITAGSLFPGLDGACEELAERNFEL
jgi:FRG domain